MIGCDDEDRVLHVCSGRVKEYPYKVFGKYDLTMDLDPGLEPDFLWDASKPYPGIPIPIPKECNCGYKPIPFIKGVLADPAYTKEFSTHYAPGESKFVSADTIVKNSIEILPVGGRVGILSLHWPRYPKKQARQVAVIAVYVGNGNLGRTFAVYEKTS